MADMVDPIGIKAGAVVDRRSTPAVSTETVAAAAPVSVVKGAGAGDTVPQEAASATLLSRAMSAQPPADAERIAKIRKAVQEGRFPLVPSTIADRLLALKLEWNPND
jgi:negative regulator of flagellin synthesis FlgM